MGTEPAARRRWVRRRRELRASTTFHSGQGPKQGYVAIRRDLVSKINMIWLQPGEPALLRSHCHSSIVFSRAAESCNPRIEPGYARLLAGDYSQSRPQIFQEGVIQPLHTWIG